MADTKITITHNKKSLVRIEEDVFVVTRIEAEPEQESYVMLTVHFARNEKEMQPGKQRRQRFLLRDDGALALAEALKGCVADNKARAAAVDPSILDAINKANKPN